MPCAEFEYEKILEPNRLTVNLLARGLGQIDSGVVDNSQPRAMAHRLLYLLITAAAVAPTDRKFGCSRCAVGCADRARGGRYEDYTVAGFPDKPARDFTASVRLVPCGCDAKRRIRGGVFRMENCAGKSGARFLVRHWPLRIFLYVDRPARERTGSSDFRAFPLPDRAAGCSFRLYRFLLPVTSTSPLCSAIRVVEAQCASPRPGSVL